MCCFPITWNTSGEKEEKNRTPRMTTVTYASVPCAILISYAVCVDELAGFSKSFKNSFFLYVRIWKYIP
ncbi:hypothetical protein AQUCO_09600013v1 [Aquilegia coerulea]|uniref:Uncharacterized protein n=1 Tax=Aquilegia coerulea TaxID=218851 RepID=A0A2G5C4C4_AQUCA|nr:hypothetical protein AQUCO_09600013v1 [Aquilegia coerulea]